MAIEIPDNILDIVNNILQNPALLNEILKLVNSGGAKPEATAIRTSAAVNSAIDPSVIGASAQPERPHEEHETDATEQPASAPVLRQTAENGSANRRKLLCAMKPYVSKERQKALDSLMAASDILEVMKSAQKV